MDEKHQQRLDILELEHKLKMIREDYRHTHIIEELVFMAKHNIRQFSRRID